MIINRQSLGHQQQECLADSSKVMLFLSNKCVSMIISNLAIKLRVGQTLSRTLTRLTKLTRNKSRMRDRSRIISPKIIFSMATMRRIMKMILFLLKGRRCIFKKRRLLHSILKFKAIEMPDLTIRWVVNKLKPL